MDILAGLKEKLRFVERFYTTASGPFLETKQKIEAEESPFEPPPFNPDTDFDTEPPFLAEWEEADDGLNLTGQAALSLVQAAFKQYLDSYIYLTGQEPPAGRGNWFERYQQFFLKTYGIDWKGGPVEPSALEEINLARNDIQHTSQEFGMTRRMSQTHYSRFPDGLFAQDVDKAMAREIAGGLGFEPRIYVTGANLFEAIRRVEDFCEFLERFRFI
jgi:hypothetical protein